MIAFEPSVFSIKDMAFINKVRRTVSHAIAGTLESSSDVPAKSRGAGGGRSNSNGNGNGGVGVGAGISFPYAFVSFAFFFFGMSSQESFEHAAAALAQVCARRRLQHHHDFMTSFDTARLFYM